MALVQAMADTCELAGWLKGLQTRIKQSVGARSAEAKVDSSGTAEDPNQLNGFINHYYTVLNAILQQTVECAYFVRDYANDRSFGERSRFRQKFSFSLLTSRPVARAAKNALSGVDARITSYEAKLAELQGKLRDNNVTLCHIQVNRVLDATQKIQEQIEGVQSAVTEACENTCVLMHEGFIVIDILLLPLLLQMNSIA